MLLSHFPVSISNWVLVLAIGNTYTMATFSSGAPDHPDAERLFKLFLRCDLGFL